MQNMDKIQKLVISKMQTAGKDWSKGWTSKAIHCHHNVSTGKRYTGANVFLTGLDAWAKDFTSNEWATFNQWFELGGGKREKQNGKWVITQQSKYKIKKGETSTQLFFFKNVIKEDKETGEKTSYAMPKVFHVFNADQIEGYTPKPLSEITTLKDRDSRAEALIAATGARIKHGGDKAFYAPAPDFIQMPYLEDFTGTDTSSDIECYYSTFFHEIAHWTSHADRLNRKTGSIFKKPEYAFEELVAECTAIFICIELGISPEPRADHAKYLNNWIEALQDNPNAMQKAFSQAQKAANYILSFEQAENSDIKAAG